MKTNPATPVYPLADALQLRLGLYRPKGLPARIVLLDKVPRTHYLVGEKYAPKIQFKPVIEASYYGTEAATVLLRISGDLYMYLVHDVEEATLTAYLLNGKSPAMSTNNIAKMLGIPPVLVLGDLKGAVVATFTRGIHDVAWTKVTPQKEPHAGTVDL